MKKNKRGTFQPRPIDRAVFMAVGIAHLLGAVYLFSPWIIYPETLDDSSLYNAIASRLGIALLAIVVAIDGIGLIYGGVGKSTHRFYTIILAQSLLWAFLIRLYALVGSLLVLESWRPPSYLTDIVIVLILGSYWLWVRVHVRLV